MNIHHITPNFAVSPQIERDDLSVLHARGYRTLICNRPDGEQPEQPAFEQIATVAKSLGMTILWQPVIGGQITPADGQQFATMLAQNPEPILAYCRTGTRSASLWALAQSGVLTSEKIRQLTIAAGYQLEERFIEPPDCDLK